MSSFTIENVLRTLTTSLNGFISVLILVATAVFLWGIVKYITAGGDEEKVKEARSMIIWGIIFLAVIVAVWGFVDIFNNFFFGESTIPKIPGKDVVNPI